MAKRLTILPSLLLNMALPEMEALAANANARGNSGPAVCSEAIRQETAPRRRSPKGRGYLGGNRMKTPKAVPM